MMLRHSCAMIERLRLTVARGFCSALFAHLLGMKSAGLVGFSVDLNPVFATQDVNCPNSNSLDSAFDL